MALSSSSSSSVIDRIARNAKPIGDVWSMSSRRRTTRATTAFDAAYVQGALDDIVQSINKTYDDAYNVKASEIGTQGFKLIFDTEVPRAILEMLRNHHSIFQVQVHSRGDSLFVRLRDPDERSSGDESGSSSIRRSPMDRWSSMDWLYQTVVLLVTLGALGLCLYVVAVGLSVVNPEVWS